MKISEEKMDDLVNSIDKIHDMTKNRKIRDLTTYCMLIITSEMIIDCLESMKENFEDMKKTNNGGKQKWLENF